MLKLNKIIFVLYALKNYIKKLVKTHISTESNKKDVLIIVDRLGVGDMVVLMEGLYNLSLYLNAKNGYNVYLATDKSLVKFLAASQSTFSFSMMDMECTMPEKYNQVSFKKNYERINSKEWDLIISIDPLGGYFRFLLMGVRYKKIIMGEILSHKPWWRRIIDKLFLNYEEINCCGTRKKFLHKVSISKTVVNEVLHRESQINDKVVYKRYKISLNLNELVARNVYCCVSTGKNSKGIYPYRAWDINKYRDVLEYILSSTHMDVILLGSDGDRDNNEKLFKMFHGNKRVRNMTCKTSFSEWMKLLSNAQFVLGNDSGYIHLSYLLGTQAFVVAGYWDYGKFLPYAKSDAKDNVPIDIRVSEPACTLCVFNSNGRTDECNTVVKNKGRYKCIDDIRAEDAIVVIDAWLIQKGLKYTN